MANKLTQTDQVLKTLDRSFDGLTFGELCTKLNDSREAVRKTLHYLHKEGRIAKANDTNGITHYNLTEKGKAKLAGTTTSSQAEIENTSVIKSSAQPTRSTNPFSDSWKSTVTTKVEPWEQLVAEAEQRGFAKGYAAASDTYHRKAYEEGKASVVKKLMELLS